MSAQMFVNDCCGGIEIRCAADEPVIWVQDRSDTVALNLNRANRQVLRDALDQADAIELEQAA